MMQDLKLARYKQGFISTAVVLAGLAGANAHAQAPSIPDFTGKSLSGETASRADLVGAPAILIVNPSPEAGDKSKAWAQEIRKEFGEDVRQRAIIAVDVPFIVTEYLAIKRAQSRVDPKYWNRTWLLRNTNFEETLGIGSGSPDPHILVLAPDGSIVARTQGEMSEEKLQSVRAAWKKASKDSKSS